MVARGADEKARKGAGAGELWLEHGSGRGKNKEKKPRGRGFWHGGGPCSARRGHMRAPARILAAAPGYRSTGRR